MATSIQDLIDALRRDLPPSTDWQPLEAAAPAPSQPGLAPSATPTLSPEQFIQQWQQTHSPAEGIQPLYQAMQQAGYNVEIPTHAGGTQASVDKLAINGAVYDLLPNVSESGLGATSWSMNPDGYWVDGKPSQTPGYYTPPAPELPPGFSTGAQSGVAPFGAVGLAAPYTQEFKPTDINSILGSDAFQAAMKNGMEAIQRSAAAKGTLLTGGTLKDLASWTQGLGLGAINDQFNRDATTYDLNRGTFWGNQNNAFNKLAGFTSLGQSGAGTLGSFGSQYANNVQQNAANAGDLFTGQANANAATNLAKGANTSDAFTNIANTLRSTDWTKFFTNPKLRQPGVYTGSLNGD